VSPLRILYVSAKDIGRAEGAGINEREFVFALAKAVGDDAHFVVPRPTGPVDPVLSGLATYTSARVGPGWWHFPISVVSQVRAAFALLRRRPFDLIVFRLDLMPVAAYLIARFAKTPVAVKSIGFGVAYILDKRLGPLGKLLNKLNLALIRGVLRRATALDVCTDRYVEHFTTAFPVPAERVALIDNATNTETFLPKDQAACKASLGLQGFDPIVGFVGGHPSERGGAQIVEALPLLAKHHPNIGAVVVGHDRDLDKLRTRAKALGVEGRLKLPGQVAYAMVPDYINTFDVCVSFDRPEMVAKIGNASQKIRQYVACGKPVVACGGGNEFLKGQGLGSIVDGGDQALINSELERWLGKSAAERQQHASRARAFAVANLGVDSTIKQRLAFWGMRLGRRAPPDDSR
jgi:glycosyltransferase involved in cell wall biosynthesis